MARERTWLRVNDAATYLTQRLERSATPVLPQYIRILASQGRVRVKTDTYNKHVHLYNRYDLDKINLRKYTKKAE